MRNRVHPKYPYHRRSTNQYRGSERAIRCPVGRPFMPESVTCQSCVRQGVVCLQSLGKKEKAERPIVTTASGRVLVTTLYLHGLNHWHGRPLHVYLKQRRAWEKVLAGTWGLWGMQAKDPGRRFLMVRRFVGSPRGMIRDRDNLIGCLKPVKDVLVKQGVFVDDEDCYLEFDIRQEVDKENPRVEIEIWHL